MASVRSSWFDPDVDPALLSSLEELAQSYQPYRVQLTSGMRRGDPRFHGKGKAIDVALYDRATGKKLDSYQGGGAVTPYQQFANAWYKGLDPARQKLARWGGYFGDPDKPGYGTRYGEQDYMHFDFGGDTAGMLGGSWAGGFKPAAMKALGLDQPGGVEALAQATGYTPDQIRAAFLSTIAGTESPGYNVLYGGGTFDDFSRHPNRAIPITSGPNKGKTSTAAGRYQFLAPTWEEQAKLSGVTDFSQASQDKVAWDYANRVFKEKAGGSLEEALASGDPGRINAAATILNDVWTSLPGGIEQAGGYGTGTFAEAYLKNLGTTAATPAAEDKPGWTPPAAKDEEKGVLETLGDDIASVAAGYGRGGSFTAPQLPAQPGAANVQAQPRQAVDPQAAEIQRQRLALAMQRLNQGTLF